MLQNHGALGQGGGSYAHFSIFMVQGRVDAVGLSYDRLGKLDCLARDEGPQFHLAACRARPLRLTKITGLELDPSLRSHRWIGGA